MRAERAEGILRWLLIVLGGLAVLAVVPLVMPFSWMQAINDRLGLEPLAETRLAHYLTRSLSAVYAHLGVLVLYLARDVRRHRDLLIFVGWLTGILGVVLTAVDFAIGMPSSWSWGEGPPTVVCAWAIVWLGRRVRPA